MKRLFSKVLLISGVVFMASCGDNRDSSTSDTTNSTMTSDSSSSMSGMDHSDSGNVTGGGTMQGSGTTAMPDVSTPNGFATVAASGGMMEVELANLAEGKAADNGVKELATMIERDHNNANNELKSIATAKNITLPAAMLPEHQSHVSMMSNMTGAEFDKAYVDMMVTDHQKDIDNFKAASSNMTDAELKAFATKTLPVLQKHLDKAKSLQGKMNK